jgi:hypothetical protein
MCAYSHILKIRCNCCTRGKMANLIRLEVLPFSQTIPPTMPSSAFMIAVSRLFKLSQQIQRIQSLLFTHTAGAGIFIK